MLALDKCMEFPVVLHLLLSSLVDMVNCLVWSTASLGKMRGALLYSFVKDVISHL